MSTDLETELRAAFEGASQAVAPPANLANKVRRAVRRRLTIGAVGAVAIVAAAVFLTNSLITGIGHPAASGGKARAFPHVIVRLAANQNIDAIAASGQYLYIATDNSGQSPYGLAAYSRATGRLIRVIGNVPSMPGSLRTGPGNSVWATFYPNAYNPLTSQLSGACGTWLLTADLAQLSATNKTCSSALLPTGRQTALIEGGKGHFGPGNQQLATVRMPLPGSAGATTIKPYASVGRDQVVSLAQVGTHVAAIVTNDLGNYHLVIAGRPATRFGGGSGPVVVSQTAEANGLWAVTASDAMSFGQLVRLSPTLRPVTPKSIATNPILGQSEKVWSAGHTVWVAADSVQHELVCFSYRSAPGRVATIPVRGQVAALAADGPTVYVTIAGGEVSEVIAYTVPRACL